MLDQYFYPVLIQVRPTVYLFERAQFMASSAKHLPASAGSSVVCVGCLWRGAFPTFPPADVLITARKICWATSLTNTLHNLATSRNRGTVICFIQPYRGIITQFWSLTLTYAPKFGCSYCWSKKLIVKGGHHGRGKPGSIDLFFFCIGRGKKSAILSAILFWWRHMTLRWS